MPRPAPSFLARPAALVAALALVLMAGPGLGGTAVAVPAPTVAVVVSATPVDDAISAFQNGAHVYESAGVDLVDGPALRSAIGSANIYIAVLQGDGDTTAAASRINQRFKGTVAVLSSTGKLSASSTSIKDAATTLTSASNAHQSGGFTKANVQATFLQFIRDTKKQGGMSAGGLIGIGVVVVAVGGALVFFGLRRRRKAEAVEQLERDEVTALLQRLGNDVLTLQPTGDPELAQALGDAGERFNAATPMLAQADDIPKLAGVRRVVLEGLAASRLARTKLGLDPGPDPDPPVVAQHEVLSAPATVPVGADSYVGQPVYRPGYSHYFGGGYAGQQYVPGGWYQQPFWQRGGISELAAVAAGGVFGGMLLQSLLGPHTSPWGLGGFGGGYGYGAYGNGWGGQEHGWGGGGFQNAGWAGGGQSGDGGGWSLGGGGGNAGGWGGGGGGGGWGGGGGGNSGGWSGGGGGDSGGGGGGGGGGGSW